MIPSNATPALRALFLERQRALTPNDRFLQMLSLNEFVKEAQTAAVRAAHPEADEWEVRLRVASRWVRNPELLLGAFGWDVEKEGY